MESYINDWNLLMFGNSDGLKDQGILGFCFFLKWKVSELTPTTSTCQLILIYWVDAATAVFRSISPLFFSHYETLNELR